MRIHGQSVSRIMALLLFYLLAMNNSFPQDNSKTAGSSKETKITDEINLSQKDLDVFKEKTKQKIDEFQEYIKIIGDKSASRDKRNLAEKEALKLFYDSAMIEISSIGADGVIKKKAYPMKEYLYKLKVLPYTKVEIEFFDIVYVQDFKKGPDGKYYGTATIFQKFTGFNGDNIVYSDITKKEIEVVIDYIEDEYFNERRWTVFLGNIKAAETKQQ